MKKSLGKGSESAAREIAQLLRGLEAELNDSGEEDPLKTCSSDDENDIPNKSWAEESWTEPSSLPTEASTKPTALTSRLSMPEPIFRSTPIAHENAKESGRQKSHPTRFAPIVLSGSEDRSDVDDSDEEHFEESVNDDEDPLLTSETEASADDSEDETQENVSPILSSGDASICAVDERLAAGCDVITPEPEDLRRRHRFGGGQKKSRHHNHSNRHYSRRHEYHEPEPPICHDTSRIAISVTSEHDGDDYNCINSQNSSSTSTDSTQQHHLTKEPPRTMAPTSSELSASSQRNHRKRHRNHHHKRHDHGGHHHRHGKHRHRRQRDREADGRTGADRRHRQEHRGYGNESVGTDELSARYFDASAHNSRRRFLDTPDPQNYSNSSSLLERPCLKPGDHKDMSSASYSFKDAFDVSQASNRSTASSRGTQVNYYATAKEQIWPKLVSGVSTIVNFLVQHPTLTLLLFTIFMVYWLLCQLDWAFPWFTELLVRTVFPLFRYVFVALEGAVKTVWQAVFNTVRIAEAHYCDFAHSWCESYKRMCEVKCSFVDDAYNKLRREPAT